MILILTGFSFARHVSATLQINEIMYDVDGSDTDREWIEVFNSSNEDLDITKVKLSEANTNHGVIASDGNSILGSIGYAVIADNPSKFRTNFPDYNGLLFDSTFSLSNEGELLSLKNEAGTIVDSVNYDISIGAKGDGKSLQKVNGVWISAIPTPGAENTASENATTTENVATTTENTEKETSTSTSNTNQSTQTITKTAIRYVSVHSSPEELSDYEENSTFDISAGRERVSYVGTPIKFLAKYKTSKVSECGTPTFSWSFGDGTKNIGSEVNHTYIYPGEYNIVLNGSCGTRNSVSRTVVKILRPEIAFSYLPSGDLRFSNMGKTEINLGDWKVRGDSGSFEIPEDTIIGAGKEVVISKDYSRVDSGNIVISLFDPSGSLISKISSSITVATSSQISIDTKTKSDDVEITKAQADDFITEFKRVFASQMAVNKDINTGPKSPSKPDGDIPSIKNIQVASVAEAVSTFDEASSTGGFWRKFFGLPVWGVKVLAKVFYDIE
jgi:hypothetical protein